MDCKKCTAPLSFYSKSKECINASRWYSNCAKVGHYELKHKDFCSDCLEGYHISETWGGCYKDP